MLISVRRLGSALFMSMYRLNDALKGRSCFANAVFEWDLAIVVDTLARCAFTIAVELEERPALTLVSLSTAKIWIVNL